MNRKNLKNVIDFWKRNQKEDYKTMNSLYKSKRYSACLFFGHLLLEKTLKILLMQKTKSYAPKIHNLRRLIDLAEVEMDEKDLDMLSEMTGFNMAGRYPEEKYDFYKVCNKKFVDYYLPEIKRIYKKLCQKIK